MAAAVCGITAMSTTLSRFALAALLLVLASLVDAQEQCFTTSFSGNQAEDGVMFDVTPNKDIIVTRFEAHLEPGSHDVEIYTKSGSKTP